jgi:hypothetical protein
MYYEAESRAEHGSLYRSHGDGHYCGQHMIILRMQMY